MKRLALALLVAASFANPIHAEPIALLRGVAVHDWLNWAPLAADGTYRSPPYRTQEEWLSGARPLTDWPAGDQFERIGRMGFDFVRLTVDPGPLVASTGTRRDEALAVLESAVRQITSADLKVVFDLHGVSQVPEYGMEMIYGGAGSQGVADYRAMLVYVARMLASVDTTMVALEPFNEPAYYPCDASGTEDWQQIMTDTVADIRSVSTDLTIIATGACGGSITGLTDLNPQFDDPNLLYSFHMYEPHSFTHQRLDDPESFASGLPWPASAGTPELTIETLRAFMDQAGIGFAQQARNLLEVQPLVAEYFQEDWGPRQLEERFSEALNWAEQHGIASNRLFMGEFGAILITSDGRMGAFNTDRLRYLTAVREQAEKHDIPWSIWEYSNPYGMSLILPTGPADADTQMLEALGLPPEPRP